MLSSAVSSLLVLNLAVTSAAVVAPRSIPTVRGALVPRREALRLLGLGSFAACLTAPGPAAAFENAIPEYAQWVGKPKRAGTPPKDLGISKRTINANSIDADELTFSGLRGCDGKPNCFSTTGDTLLEDRILTGVDTLVVPWKPPASDSAPFKSLAKAVKAYQPGQGFVDGGGFQVVKETETYLYLQFESLKKGYIDDVEFAARKDGSVEVRSSSRVGQTDFGVNAIRLNAIAGSLRKDGWEIADISEKTHPDYFAAANDARDLTYDKDRRKLDGFDEKTGENGRLERPSIG